jgi:hypothetical protein
MIQGDEKRPDHLTPALDHQRALRRSLARRLRNADRGGAEHQRDRRQDGGQTR